MGLLVNGAIGALAAVVGSLVTITFVSSKLAFAGALLFGLVGFFGAGQVFAVTPEAPATTERKPRRKGQAAALAAAPEIDLDDEVDAKAAKKAKKLAAEKAKKEAAEQAKREEAAAKAAAKKAAKKKAAAAPVVESSESESEPEPEPVVEEESSAPKSKSAIKKAKAKAKELAAKLEAEKAAKAAEKAAKKQKKAAAAEQPAAAAAPAAGKGAKQPAAAAAPTAAQSKAAAAAAAAAAADLDGWETIEATKPTKSQLLAKAAAAAAPEPTSTKKGKKTESIPASERELTEDLIVPVKNHALLVGKAGATLQLLQSGSGARIDMPKRDSNSSKIQVTGTPAQVYAAKNAIESLLERGFSQFTHPGFLSDDLSIDPKEIGQVIGANGANLRRIQEATKTKVNLPEKGSNSKKVTIVGEKEGVKAAKAAIKSLIADGFSSITNPTWIKREVDVPAEKFGVLIGPKGQSIKSIQGDSGARINMPAKGSASASVSVVGEEAAVAKAIRQINKLLEPPAPLPEPEDLDLATDDAWGQEHTAQGEDALW